MGTIRVLRAKRPENQQLRDDLVSLIKSKDPEDNEKAINLRGFRVGDMAYSHLLRYMITRSNNKEVKIKALKQLVRIKREKEREKLLNIYDWDEN